MDGIFFLFWAFIPWRPALIVSTNWLVVANTIKSFGSSANFFSAIWFEEINKDPSLAIKYSQVVNKKSASSIFAVVLKSKPDVFNHNLETVPRLYLSIRPGARYFNSLKILSDAKNIMPEVFTKSGLMVGLGENKDELIQVMDDLRIADVDFLTIGQYLQPSVKHHPLERYYHPDEFKDLENIAKSKGFLLVSSSPLTRSSYHADEDFAQLQKNRLEKYNAQSFS